ncbi:GntR family transcriptional regulator [Amycolatopsis pigmentata]|uniref:GntR family transcriptional regulator n=1 Tax=Amycolatopsis pigmentata TaxID=450801 RepID=A0ABW5G1Q4_9PSEU
MTNRSSHRAEPTLERTLAPPTARRDTLVDQVVRRLRREITRGTLDPGRHLVETRLAEDFSVSRGTIREALTRLASTGLVEFVAGSGHRVRYFSDGDVVEIGEVFAALEGRAALHTQLPLEASIARELRDIAERMRGLRVPDDLDELLELDRSFHATLMGHQPRSKLFDAWKSQEPLLSLMVIPLLRRGHSASQDHAARHLLLLDAAMSGEASKLIEALEDHYHQHE